MNLAQIRQLAQDNGFPDPDLAAAIANAESGGDSGAVGDHGDSIGLWQIDTKYHAQYAKSDLEDPAYNAQAAFAISSGGTNWRPWSTAWEDAANQVGYLGPRAPFHRYYRGGGSLSTQQKLLLAGSVATVAAAIWYGLRELKPAPRRRRAPARRRRLVYA